MTWSRLDDKFYSHPKVIAAGTDGVCLFILGLSWCSDLLTDGFIPEAQVRRLSLSDNSSTTAERLVKVGLWERRDGGYQIHDYLDYNPSRTKVKAMRQARARAGREGGLRSGEARRKQGEEADEANGKQMPSKTEAKTNPTPTPTPIPESPSPKTEAPLAANAHPPKAKAKAKPSKPKAKKPPTPAAVKVFRENAHRYPPKAWYSKIADAVGEDPADLEFWGQVVLAYIGLGWNPGNVSNMLEFYERRETPTTKGQGKGNAHNGPDEWLARREEMGMGGAS